MRYFVVVAVAGLSLLLAIPIALQPAKQPIHLLIKPVDEKVAVVNTNQNITVPATVKPVVTPASYIDGCNNYTSTFEQYDWNVNIALAICQAESNGNVYAVSETNDYGLMQLHNQAIFNPYSNIAAGYKIYLEQGWQAWTTYNTGAYLQYI